MVFVKFEGADQYIATDFSLDIQSKLTKLYGIKENELNFLMEDSFFVHHGQEQTSFQVLVEILAPEELMEKEKEVEKFLAKELNNLAIHSHILFRYFPSSHAYDEINPDYPEYMTPDNMVKAESGQEQEDEEREEEGLPVKSDLFTGNIFQELDDFVAAHPEMGKDEATIEYYKRKRRGKF